MGRHCSALLLLLLRAALLSTGCYAMRVASSPYLNIPYARIPPSQRKFTSPIIDSLIINISTQMANEDLATLFQNTFPNTLDTTVVYASANDSFVITGDIDALWLRDSTNQMLPYIPFAQAEANLTTLLQGLVLRQMRSLIMNPYAEAFNFDNNGNGEQSDINKPPMTAGVFEEKYELDSLVTPIKFAFEVCKEIGAEFLAVDANLHTFVQAIDHILTTMEVQQQSTEEQNGTYPYEFYRPSCNDRYPRLPVNFTGMVRSAFRPSDDDTTYDFLVPSNFMAMVAMNQLSVLISEYLLPYVPQQGIMYEVLGDFVNRAQTLRQEISSGIEQFAVQTFNASASPVAYEVDGRGHFNFMDDANVPSLLSLPFLGYDNLSSYDSVRRWVLSESNPWFFTGTAGEGVGSPHTGPNMIWPMSITMRALTSNNDTEIVQCLEMLLNSANNTGFIHESFDKDNAASFTRPWFAWANTLFGSLIVHLAETKPHIIFE